MATPELTADRRTDGLPYGWLPFVVGLVSCALVLGLWLTLQQREEVELRNRIRAQADYLAGRIEADLRNRIPALQRIALAWEARGGMTRETFTADAESYLRDTPGFQAIEHVDSDLVVRWIVPLTGNEQALNLHLAFEPQRRNAVERARSARLPAMTGPVDLVQGGKGFLVYVPLNAAGKFDGFILGVLRAPEWLQAVLDVEEYNIAEHFRIAVFVDDIQVFTDPRWNRSTVADLDASSARPLFGHIFSVQLRPTRNYLQENSTILPELTAVFGFLLSIAAAVALHLFQKASFETAAAVDAIKARDAEINERKHAQELLATERQRLASILEGTNVGTWEWNLETGETVFNERWAGIIGYTLEELAPVSIETWTRLAHPVDLQLVEAALERHFSGEVEHYECEVRMRHKNGRWVWVLDRGKVTTRNEDGKPLMMFGTHQEITERKEAEDKIRHLATHDGLTGLPAMVLARDRLAVALAHSKRSGTLAPVFFIDLDGFKSVNDTLGHDAGDEVLRNVARRLLSCVRATDTLARLGGDEFLFFGSSLHERDHASVIAESMLSALARPITLANEKEVTVGASIGIAIYPLDSDEPEELIRIADEAMYEVKKAGKNGYRYASVAPATA